MRQQYLMICMLLAFVLINATQLGILPTSCAPSSPQAAAAAAAATHVWLVHRGALVANSASSQQFAEVSHHKFLSSVLPISEEIARRLIIYSYNKSFDGFAALLTAQQAASISAMPGVASVFQSRNLGLHTTRSWTLLGLSSQSPANLKSQRNILIGVMDTGLWPESESFSDSDQMVQDADIPESTQNKIAELKHYSDGAKADAASNGAAGSVSLVVVKDNYESPIDYNGHGTHTASTAAGNAITGASLYGLAEGQSQGGAPGGRIASYKVCWNEGYCNDADILSAFDNAIHKGVHVLSISFGGPSIDNLFADSVALGSFYAVQKGIVVVCSVGNNGPDIGEATNVAPWVITVAASSIDRQFYSTVVLGNNVTLKGRAINTEVPEGHYSLIYGANAGLNNLISSNCSRGSLDPTMVKGKIVVCESGVHPEQSTSVSLAGGVGMLIVDDSATEIGAFTFGVPTSVIGREDGDTLLTYALSNSNPTAQILHTVDPLLQPSALLGSFSSRGPNRVNYPVLKPDLTGPGVSILASWSHAHSITNEPQDNRLNVSYNIVSGTSVASPHVAGAVAYVKSFHPAWSPAAIKSALMTTAMQLDVGHASNEDGEFGFGSGLIQPQKALHPGLVYDIAWEDYAEWLCSQGYDPTKMRLMTGSNKTCSTKVTNLDLNYPAVSVPVEGGSGEPSDRWWQFTRTVTNVGGARSVYKAEVQAPEGMKVVVSPETITFSKLQQKKTFVIKVQAPGLKTSISPNIGNRLSAYLVWKDIDGVFLVRMPIVAWITPKPHEGWSRSNNTPSIGFRV